MLTFCLCMIWAPLLLCSRRWWSVEVKLWSIRRSLHDDVIVGPHSEDICRQKYYKVPCDKAKLQLGVSIVPSALDVHTAQLPNTNANGAFANDHFWCPSSAAARSKTAGWGSRQPVVVILGGAGLCLLIVDHPTTRQTGRKQCSTMRLAGRRWNVKQPRRSATSPTM